MYEKHDHPFKTAEPEGLRPTKLQQRYDELKERGLSSVEAAFLVGAYLEEVTISGFIKAASHTDGKDLRGLYSRLKCDSIRHLKAFAEGYESVSGRAYKAQFLSGLEVCRMLDQSGGLST